eukprot:TRINITY_DN1625_c0_g2_i1.p1 TRINITY_DN1625_c0_g2~~TRINITY_DN1625_c0_g2_i1.p1  ORF type:complete len:815 (-),score=314.30 TRINITY_DN1625_c0_g2_i1:375-2819(-)
MEMMSGVTRTPSGRIRRIPSDLMKRVRCAYPGCELAVIPSNFARHWKFKHTDLPQPPIESLTVLRGDNISDSGGDWPALLKNSQPPPLDSSHLPSVTLQQQNPLLSSSSNAPKSITPTVTIQPANLPLTSHLRVDGKERKRARQRNYICPECHRPLIGSNFGRHWASKHPHLPQPSLVNLEMEALSGGEEDPLSISPEMRHEEPKLTVKKRKVVCRECEMPMISSNFSRHWASRHPHLEMPLLSELEVIDVEVDASPPSKKPAMRPPMPPLIHQPITIPYPEDEEDDDYFEEGGLEPADEDFEDVEEIEDDEVGGLSPPPPYASIHKKTHINNNNHVVTSHRDYDEEEDLEEVTVEPVTYSNGGSYGSNAAPGGGSMPPFLTGGKRHKKVYCPECNMPMLCNNFRRHFHRRHGEMLHRMPSIHSLKLVPDDEYELAQINKVPPSSSNNNNNSSSSSSNSNSNHNNHASMTASLSYAGLKPELPSSCTIEVAGGATTHSGSPARVKRKIVCSECGMAMIGSNFGRHWASKHPHLPQPALQDLVYADSAEIGEAETVVCEPLFFGPASDDEDGCFDGPEHLSPYSHLLQDPCMEMSVGSVAPPPPPPPPKVKKVWKKKVICPECNLQTISSNFSRHWVAKHGHLPTPNIRDLRVISMGDPGFMGSAPEAEEIVVDPSSIPGPQFLQINQEEEFDEEIGLSEEEEDGAGIMITPNVVEEEEDTSDHSIIEEDDDEEGLIMMKPYAQLISSPIHPSDIEEDIEEEEEEETRISPSPIHKYSNNKINCNFDINSLLEDDDDVDGDDQDESGEFASVEVN